MNSPAAAAAHGATTAAVTTTVATPDLIRQIVAEVRDKTVGRSLTGPLVIGVRARAQWDHGAITPDDTNDTDGSTDGEITVVAAPSPLAVRSALARFGPWIDGPEGSTRVDTGGTLVLLTELSEAELGADILGRFVTPRLLALNPWDAVCHRFGVRALDPLFSDQRYSWMADALLAIPHKPSGHGGGTLGLDDALRMITESAFGATDVRVERLLIASADPGFNSRVEHGDPRMIAMLCQTLGQRLGPAGALVTGMITRGRGELALAAGLAARTVIDGVEGSYAQAKIADLTGEELPTDDALRSWARSAELAFAQLATSDDPVTADVAMAGSRLVSEWQAHNPAASNVLSISFEKRLDHLAIQLESMIDPSTEPDPDTLRVAVAEVMKHRDALVDIGQARAQRAQLAARLASWLRDPASAEHGTGPVTSPDGVPVSLARRIRAYLGDGAWVDSARRRVGEGDDSPESFARALRSISEAAHAARATGNESFARTLASWTTHGEADELGGSSVVAVERIVSDVVAPLASVAPVLLVVLDGCGVAQFLEFADQFRNMGLREIGRKGSGAHKDIAYRMSGLAVLPTVTAVSRTSLLSGRLTTGGASDERQNLPAHPAIAKLSGPQARVFHHHSDLVSGSGLGLPAPVKEALSAAGPRVVAAVVNTIDDELAKGTFNPRYRIEQLGPLQALLRAAVEAERLVVITADHGHVLGIGLDGKGQVDTSGEGGERWRVADREPEATEVLLVGPRVLRGDERGVLAPWNDDLRYSAKHGGYHGGATPDECIVPLSVFTPLGMDPPKGWDVIAQVTPTWWDLHVERPLEPSDVAKPKKTKPKRRRKPTEDEATLFPVPDGDAVVAGDGDGGAGGGDAVDVGAGDVSDVAVVPSAPWIDEVIGSDMYALQLGAIPRSKPKEPAVRATLAALHTRGGVASFGVIAQATGMPLSRMNGFLATLGRLLNVDGFGVIDVDPSAQEARLDEGLLRTQFLGGDVSGGEPVGGSSGGGR